MHDNRSPLYHRHRFPPEIIAEAVWLESGGAKVGHGSGGIMLLRAE